MAEMEEAVSSASSMEGGTELLRCKNEKCRFLAHSLDKMLHHSVYKGWGHRFAQRVAMQTLSNGSKEMYAYGEDVDLESLEYLDMRCLIIVPPSLDEPYMEEHKIFAEKKRVLKRRASSTRKAAIKKEAVKMEQEMEKIKVAWDDTIVNFGAHLTLVENIYTKYLVENGYPTDSPTNYDLTEGIVPRSPLIEDYSVPSRVSLQATRFLDGLAFWTSSTSTKLDLPSAKGDICVLKPSGTATSLVEDILPSDKGEKLRILHQGSTRDMDGSAVSMLHLVGMTNHLWTPGDTIKIAFLDGTPQQHQDVMDFVQEWEKHAYIYFSVVSQDKSDIRVSFEGNNCSSYIGTIALDIPKEEATLLLGIKPWNRSSSVKRVVLHEFGHALGCGHEHCSPYSPIDFDKDREVCAYHSINFGWNAGMIKSNLKKYDPRKVRMMATPYDTTSIMHYKFPSRGIQENFSLSVSDQIGIGAMYPFPVFNEKGTPSSKQPLQHIFERPQSFVTNSSVKYFERKDGPVERLLAAARAVFRI